MYIYYVASVGPKTMLSWSSCFFLFFLFFEKPDKTSWSSCLPPYYHTIPKWEKGIHSWRRNSAAQDIKFGV